MFFLCQIPPSRDLSQTANLLWEAMLQFTPQLGANRAGKREYRTVRTIGPQSHAYAFRRIEQAFGVSSSRQLEGKLGCQHIRDRTPDNEVNVAVLYHLRRPDVAENFRTSLFQAL